MKKILFNIVLFGWIPLFATAKGSYEDKKHRFNQKIIQSIMQEYSSTSLSVDCIEQIGKEALERGFDVTAYSSSKTDQNNACRFARVPLWEGGDTPYILYIYIWPSKQMVTSSKYDNVEGKKKNFYSSAIHSHSFPFAFYVLEGTMVQYLYERVGGRVVKRVLKEVYPPACFMVDKQEDQLIHRLVCEHPDLTPAYTLHMFNIGKDEEYQEMQELMREELEYHKVLKKDGSIQVRDSENF